MFLLSKNTRVRFPFFLRAFSFFVFFFFFLPIFIFFSFSSQPAWPSCSEQVFKFFHERDFSYLTSLSQLRESYEKSSDSILLKEEILTKAYQEAIKQVRILIETDSNLSLSLKIKEILLPLEELYDLYSYFSEGESSPVLFSDLRKKAFAYLRELDYLLFTNEKIYQNLIQKNGEMDETEEAMRRDYVNFMQEQEGMHLSQEARLKLYNLNQKIQEQRSIMRTLLHLHFMNYELFISSNATETAIKGFPLREDLAAKETAKRRRFEGYAFNFHLNSFYSFLTYSNNRDLRKEFYRNYFKKIRSQTLGTYEIARKTLEALLLQRKGLINLSKSNESENKNERGLVNNEKNKFIAKIKDINDLEREIKRDLSFQSELSLLRSFAKEKDGLEDLAPWDYLYYINLYKKEVLKIDDYSLSDFLSIEKMLASSFALISPIVFQSSLDRSQEISASKMGDETNEVIEIREVLSQESIFQIHKNLRVFEIMGGQETLGFLYFKVHHTNQSLIQKKVLDHFAKVRLLSTHETLGRKIKSVSLELSLDFIEGLPYFIHPRNYLDFVSAFQYALELVGISGGEGIDKKLAYTLRHYASDELIPKKEADLLLQGASFFKRILYYESFKRRLKNSIP